MTSLVSIVTLGVAYHVSFPWGMSYLFYYTEHPPTPPAPKFDEKSKLTWAVQWLSSNISEYNYLLNTRFMIVKSACSMLNAVLTTLRTVGRFAAR